MICLPNDVVERGYKQVSQYQYEQVFFSPSKKFEGTGKEFLKKGYAYEYIQISTYKRQVIS